MIKAVVAGWILSVVGFALWGYGYLVAGHPPLVDWHAAAPSWVADFLPNIEAEVGVALMCVALAPMYWPDKGSRAG